MEEQGSGDQFSGLNTFAEQQVETEKGAFMYVQRECSPTWLRGCVASPSARALGTVRLTGSFALRV